MWKLLSILASCALAVPVAACDDSSAQASCSRTGPTGARWGLAPHLGFVRASGWQTRSTRDSLGEATWALSGKAPVDAGGDGGFRLIPHLASGQVLIVVAAYAWPRGHPSRAASHGVGFHCLPLRIGDAKVEAGWEGQPRPGIPQYQLVAWVNDQLIDAKVFFSRQDPSASELARAEGELRRLRIPAMPVRPSLPPPVPEPPLS